MSEPPHVEVVPIAIGQYAAAGLPDLELIDDEVAEVVGLFAPFGGVEVPWTTPMRERGADAVDARLRVWVRSDHPHAVLYWAGHGSANRRRPVLAHANSPCPVGESGVSAQRVAEAISLRTPYLDDHWMIVIIDACWSAAFAKELVNNLDTRAGPRHVLLIGTSGDGSTTLGAFTAALRNILHGTFGADPEIRLWDLIPALRDALPGASVLDHDVHRAVLRRTVPPLTSAPLDVVDEINAVLAELTEDERVHFIPKAQSAELGEQSWFFVGREHESTRISTWLRQEEDGMLVVTGRAGSGKSALLGHLLVQSRPQLRVVLARHGLVAPAPEVQRPPDNVFDIVLHLTGLSTSDVIARLAADAGLAPPPAGATLSEMLDWLAREITALAPLTILADALDEAVDPLSVADAILRRFATIPRVRVVVGTRRSTREGPDVVSPDNTDLLDALRAAQSGTVSITRDSAAIARYVSRKLTTRYGVDEDGSIAEISAVIGAGRHEFLFARLAVHEILATGTLPTTSTLSQLLAGDHRALFRRAVERLRRTDRSYAALLRAAGFSRGRGLPIRDGVFAAVASALADAIDVTDGHVHQFRHDAAPYLTLDREYGQTVYRLAHRTFAELFTVDHAATTADREAHLAITRHLLELAARQPAQSVNPYVQHYLSAHAGLAGESGWIALDDHPTTLDRLDPEAVAADAMRTGFGFHPLPPRVAGVVAAGHLLASTEISARRGVRQLAMTRHTPVARPAADESDHGGGMWSVRWSALRQHPLHRTLVGHDGPVEAVAVASLPGGRAVLATGGGDNTLRLWDPILGHPIGDPIRGHAGAIRSLTAVSLGSERVVLATGGTDTVVRVWDALTGHPVGDPITGHTDTVRSLVAVCLPDGRTALASGSADATVRLWEPLTGRALGPPITAHDGAVEVMAALRLSDGRCLLVTGGADSVVRLWDPATGRAVGGPLVGHLGPVIAAAPVPLPGRRVLLATGGADGTVRLWDPVTTQPVRHWTTHHAGGVEAVAAVPLPDGRCLLATGGADGTLRTVDAMSARAASDPFTGHTQTVVAVATVPLRDRRVLLVTGSWDRTVRVWDPLAGRPASGPPVRQPRHIQSMTHVPLLDGRVLLAAGGWEGDLYVWDARSGAEIGDSPAGHANTVTGLAPLSLPDGRVLLASGSRDRTVRLWDPLTGRPVGEPLTGHAHAVDAVAAVPLPDGPPLIAASCADGTVRLWDPLSGRQVKPPFTGHTGDVRSLTAIRLAGGRTFLASAGWDRTVRVWDVTTGRMIGDPLVGHLGAVAVVAAVPLPDGDALLASGGVDRTIRLWHPLTGRPVGDPLTGHQDTVHSIAAVPRPDGRVLLVTGSHDGTIRLWDPTTRTALATFPVGSTFRALAHLHADTIGVGTEDGVVVISLGMT